MLTDLFGIFHNLNQFIGKILWMRGHKPDPFQAFNLLDFLKKLCKGYRLLKVFSVGIYILPKQHDLNHAILYQHLDFPDNILWTAAPFSSPDIGYNTIAAEIIAPKHNVDAGFKEIFPIRWKLLHDLIRVLPDVNDHAVRFKHRD